MTKRHRPFIWGLLLAAALAGAETARAQVPVEAPADSVQAAPDTLEVLPQDTLQTAAPTDESAAIRQPAMPAGPPLSFAPPEPGAALDGPVFVLTPYRDATDVLALVPGSFRYGFGEPGWPDGWAPFGLSPRRVALGLNGLPFDDLITGRPRFDLIPVELLEPFRIEPVRFGEPVGVQATIRAFEAPEPLTEIRYRGGGGLQGVSVAHAQGRPRALFGQPGTWNVLASFSGHGARGLYAGAPPYSARRVFGRLRYAQHAWSIELSNVHNRLHAGAHGGVDPNEPSIYDPLIAELRHPEARQHTRRNDFALTLRLRRLAGLPEPLTVSTYWTAQSSWYTGQDTTLAPATDTLAANRFGLRARQALPGFLPGHTVLIRVDGWLDRLPGGTALSAAHRSRPRLQATLQDSTRLAGLDLIIEGGFHLAGGARFPAASVQLSRAQKRVRGFLELLHTGHAPAWLEAYGLAGLVQAADAPAGGQTTRLLLGAETGGPGFSVRLSALAQQMNRLLELYTGETDETAFFAVLPAPVRRVGAMAELRWRRGAERGLYGFIRPTLLLDLEEGASPLHLRLAAGLPQVFGDARLGARFRLFENRLDLDGFLQTRFWSGMRSRDFHAPTSRFALPRPEAPSFGPAGTVDAFLEARIRTATVFLAYENALAGTFYPGTLLVPAYPLPAQRFRFGVFWPIAN